MIGGPSALGSRFEQHAIVVGSLGNKALLLACPNPDTCKRAK